MDNIDCFDDFVAAILADLYRAFPVPVDLDARTLSGHGTISDAGVVVDERGVPSRRFEIADATLWWLMNTGYFIMNGGHGMRGGYLGTVLSDRGLHLLKAVPASSPRGESLGEILVRAVREGRSSLARETARAVMAEGVGIMLG